MICLVKCVSQSKGSNSYIYRKGITDGLHDKIRYFGYEPANYIKFTQMSCIYLSMYVSIYLSIYLSALEDILIMIIYLLTGRPDARKTHTQPGRPSFFFVAWNSLKYGETLIALPILTNFYPTFSQNRVKIGPKFVL